MSLRSLASDVFLGTNTLFDIAAERNRKYNSFVTQGMSDEAAQAAADKLIPRGRGEKVLNKLGPYVDDAAKQTHQAIFNAADQVPVGKGGFTATRLAGNNPVMKKISRVLPVLGAGMAVLDAGDIVFGQESAANKVMDGTAMAIGGAIGGIAGMGNPLLAAAGASTGKMVSDGIQYLFGDKKSAEQRKMEEALAALQGRYI